MKKIPVYFFRDGADVRYIPSNDDFFENVDNVDKIKKCFYDFGGNCDRELEVHYYHNKVVTYQLVHGSWGFPYTVG